MENAVVSSLKWQFKGKEPFNDHLKELIFSMIIGKDCQMHKNTNIIYTNYDRVLN